MSLIGTKLCKRRSPPSSATLFQFVMSLFLSPSVTFYNRQISMPLCSCPLAAQKKHPDEYTTSQEDLLIGGSLSASVVELSPNPSFRLNETVQIPHDGPRQQLLEWVGRMRSKGKGEKKHPRPPPTVHAPWSHLNQSPNPG